MDLQSRQICKQPKRKELILEARHSKCIEASNRIRSKLSPRLFMPRTPLYTHHPTKTQHCPKELKSTFFKSQNFKNFNNNTDFAKENKSVKKCQTQKGESFAKRLRGKNTKKSMRRGKLSKTMEHLKANGCKWPNGKTEEKRSKTTETDKNVSKRIKKQTKGKCGNLKMNENSTDNVRYSTDGDIIFLNDNLCLNSPTTTYPATQQNFQMNRTVTATTFYPSETLNKANTNTGPLLAKVSVNGKQHFVHIPPGTTSHKGTNSRVFEMNMAENIANISVQNSLQFDSKNLNSSRDLLTKNHEINKENPKESISNSPQLQTNNISEYVRVPELNSKQSTCEEIRNYLNLQTISKKNSRTFTQQNSIKINDELTYSTNHLESVPNCQQTLDNKARNSHNSALYQKSTSAEHATIPNIANSTKHPKQYLTNGEFENPYLQLPIDSYLNIATTAVTDFQNIVKTSLSQIYDSSPIDKTITEELISLKNSVESFSKSIRQSYNDLELMDSKTNNCIAYLNRKNIKDIQMQLRSPISYLNKPTNSEETPETLTILIEAYKMPAKTITYKMSDIIQSKFYYTNYNESSCDNFADISKEQIGNTSINLKRKNSAVSLDLNENLSNTETINQIQSVPNPNQLIKETRENSFQESTKSSENLLQTFVKDSIQKPASVNPFNIPRKVITMATKCSNEESIITVQHFKPNSSSQMEPRPKHTRRKCSTKMSNIQTHKSNDNSNINIKLNANKLNTTATIICPQNQGFDSTFTNPHNLIYTQAENNCTMSNIKTHKSNDNSNINIKLNANKLNTTTTIICPQNQGFDSTFTNPHNLIYTQAENNCASLLIPNPLHFNSFTNGPNPTTSQATILNADLLTNSYNYSLATYNSLYHNLPAESTAIHGPYLYPSRPYPNPEHQVTNETPLLVTNHHNHLNTHTFPNTPPNFISNNPRPASYPREFPSVGLHNYSEYPKGVLNMSYLQSPYSYYHSSNLMPYNTQFFDVNSRKFAATNFPPERDFKITNPLVSNTKQPVQPFLNRVIHSEFQMVN